MSTPRDDSKSFKRRVQKTFHASDSSYNLVVAIVKTFVVEVVCTGILIFLGCLAVKTQKKDHLGVTLCFGLAAFTAIQIGCHNTGGHVNPCVTVCGVILKKISWSMGIVYVIAQCVGSILAFGLLKALSPSTDANEPFCSTLPRDDMTLFQSFLFEFITTGILILVVCSIWDPNNGTLYDAATLKFGIAIFVLAYSGASYTGCSMNPARSLGPALWNNQWTHHWIYWLGPLLGSAFVSANYRFFFCGNLPPLKPLPLHLSIPVDELPTSAQRPAQREAESVKIS